MAFLEDLAWLSSGLFERFRALFLHLLILIPLSGSSLQDQDPAPSDVLEEVIITASRLDVEESSRFRIGLIDSDKRSPLEARTIGDHMDHEPAIHLQRTSYGQMSPYLRGQTGFRTLILIDGIRLNNSTFRSGPNQYLSLVDPLSLGAAEVIFGPGSVLHGSDAAGGTIALTSRSVEPGPVPMDETRFMQRYASAERSSVSRIEQLQIREDYAIRFGASYRDYDDFVAGRSEGLQENTGYREWSGDLSLVSHLGPELDLMVGIQHHRQEDVPRTHSTIFGSNWHGLQSGTDLQRDIDGGRDLIYFRLRQYHDGDSQSEWTISRQQITDEEDRIRSNGRQRVQGFEDEALGLSYTWDGITRWGEISTGFDFTHESVDSHYTEFDQDGTVLEVRPRGPVADDSTYQLFGAYLQDTISIDDRTSVVLGGRWTRARVDARQVDPDPSDADVIGPIEDQWSDFIGSVRGIYHKEEDLRFFGGLSQAFRAPNLSDLTRFDVGLSGEAEIPAPGLDPEHFLTAEVGVDFIFDQWRGEAVLWHSLLDDLVTRFPTGEVNADGDPIVTKENSGAGQASGFDLRMVRQWDERWSSSFSLSWITGEVEAPVAPGVVEEQPLSRLAPAMARGTLRYQPVQNFSLEASLTVAGNQDKLSSRDLADIQRIPPGGTPGYAVIDLHGRWQASERWHWYAGATNIGDVDYRLHGSGSNEPGASIVTGVEARF